MLSLRSPLEQAPYRSRRYFIPTYLTLFCFLLQCFSVIDFAFAKSTIEKPAAIPEMREFDNKESVDPLASTKISKSLLEMTSMPDMFYPYGRFIIDTVIPQETIYFEPEVGMDRKTGLPYDHIRIRLQRGQIGERGNYTAASKISLAIPYLLGVMLRKPVYEKSRVSPELAEEMLENALKTLRRYDVEFPEYDGFLAWSDVRSNGSIAPASYKMPSLDNGQLSWALAAVAGALQDSKDPKHREMAKLAENFLNSQNYIKFYDFNKKLLHGTIQYDPTQKVWTGDKTYYLNDMYEGTLAVLWAVLNAQVPEEAWHNLSIPTAEYLTSHGEIITTLKGYRASFHEHWGLVYLPLMKSALAPLYQNYLYVQADYARRHGLPGFLSTSYDANGNYRQMGVPEIASQPVDRSDVAVVFATALAMLISPQTGAKWLENMMSFGAIVTPYGAVESVGPDGYADIMTADGKGLTVMAASGGVLSEVEKYLKSHKVPGTDVPMYTKLIELYHSKYLQLMRDRKQEPIRMPTRSYPSPAKKQMEVRVKNIPLVGDTYSITDHLQAGHLHGKNVRSIGLPTMEDDIRPGKDFSFTFDVPAYMPYFDQWAFRGTYMDQAMGIEGVKYLSVTIPVDTEPARFDMEFKSDDITLTHAMIDTVQPGYVSEDGQWKTYIEKLNVIPESVYKPFNYFSVTMHDPSYLTGEYAKYGRQGDIILRNIQFLRKHPYEFEQRMEEAAVPEEDTIVLGDVEVTRYWRISHGELDVKKDEIRGLYQFPGGKGWKGGYLPYIALDKFRFLHVKVRNPTRECNCFYIELKNENNQILGKKYPIKLAANNQWYTFEIRLPTDLTVPLNYLAFSDPVGNFDLGSISFSDIALDRSSGNVIPIEHDPTLKCDTACSLTAS